MKSKSDFFRVHLNLKKIKESISKKSKKNKIRKILPREICSSNPRSESRTSSGILLVREKFKDEYKGFSYLAPIYTWVSIRKSTFLPLFH